MLGVCRFDLFRCVYSSFHNRLELTREPAFYWPVFYFPNLSVFVSSYVNMKKFCSFWFRVWDWASNRFLPLAVFFSLLALFLEL